MASGLRCGKWLPSKRRQCASWALPGQLYCGNHRLSTGTERRVQCPLDPSHTVLEADVDAHSKKCPAIKQLQRFDNQAYFRRGLNAGSEDEGEQIRVSSKRAAICELSVDAFRELVRRINAAIETHCQEAVEDSVCEPEVCSNWRERDRRLPFQEKHVVQQASILGNLEALGLVDGETCFVEFGAGRGYLSHMLCDCFEVRKLVMVERRSYKFKADRTLRQQAGVLLERLRIDIEDLDVSGIQALQGLPYVGMSKHLCGAATDLTLRCCVLGQAERENAVAAATPVFCGLAIATCCHHLCRWKSYVNKAFFRALGFGGDDFGFITWLSSWALSGDTEHGGIEGERGEAGTTNDGFLDSGDPKSKPWKPRLSEALMSVNPDERKELGIKCKRLIDFGRLQWLNQRGMESKLVRYVSKSVSPENTLLLARRRLA